ncbi:hypothetical protein [Flammeovirga kamogawensis]|uniref:Uncharacterized protein n=1 Tax=Flammeovirga kamogawensis TaxID=373891 RepID=A0ABX8GYD4_9BACT|nr:hypothetical protein [Flammeovirga kamogawensis]MBB6460582.1 hypothetical protein [Flammeovirga kamogawensis]QWG07940.1 hypothetical protein KM029_03120 [Flammeovirga kamogawensis]TRX69749.1 hypothetical protein EO216_17055 [Flammeovirga kamogawensis]
MKINQLEQIELEFEILIQKDRRNWLRVAKLLDQIESTQLYKLRSRSFTEYVKGLADKNRINISTLWRARSGAKLYLEILGMHELSELDESVVKTTPEQLETFSKVRTIAPTKIVEEVKAKMLEGENMRHELKELWHIYRPLKGGKTERGRKKEGAYVIEDKKDKTQFVVPYNLKNSIENEHVEDNSIDRYWEDLKKMEKYQLSSENLARANILNALRSDQWLARTLNVDFCSRHEHLIAFNLASFTSIDILSLCKANKDDTLRPIVIGAHILTEINDLNKERQKIIKKFEYCDYFYIAIPLNNEYIEKVEGFTKKYPNIGIICVGDTVGEDNKHVCKIYKLAKFNKISAQNEYIIMQKCMERLLGWT